MSPDLSPAILATVPTASLLSWQAKGSCAQRREARAELSRRYETKD